MKEGPEILNGSVKPNRPPVFKGLISTPNRRGKILGGIAERRE